MRALPLLLQAIFSLSLMPLAQATTHIDIPSRVCDVTHYGADGSLMAIGLSTNFIQKAIDDCAEAGGGTVEIPAGNYLSNPLILKSNIRLHLAKNANLVASTEETAYSVTPETERYAAENRWRPFISVANAQNVAITGEGSIDGQGAVWWERWRANVRANPSKRGSTDRPRLIYIKSSQNVLVEGLTLTNSPSFHVVMRYSDGIDVNRTRIITPWHAPNTDAIDPIDSRNVRITNNYIDCNDDHVAIKAEKFDPKFPDGVVSNIYIAHNTLMQGRGISIGSESSGGVNGVLAEDNSFQGSMYGLRIKSPRGKGGNVTHVVYRDIKMVDVGTPIVISGYYQGGPASKEELDKKLAAGGFMVGEQIYPADTDPALPFDAIKTPHFSQITVKNLISTGKSKAAGFVIGVPEAQLTDITFDNVRIEADTGMLVRNAAVSGNNLQVKARKGDAFILQKDGVVSKD